jgi:hypothetical protein
MAAIAIAESETRSRTCTSPGEKAVKQKRLTSMTVLTFLFVLIFGANACNYPEAIGAKPTAEPTLEPVAQQPTELGLNPTAEPALPTTAVPTSSPTAVPTPSPTPRTDPNPIASENQKPGTVDWQTGPGFDTRAAYSQIAGFADAVSVNIGGTINFMISTRTAGITYTLGIYRLGWYGGQGGREMQKVPGLKGQAQGYWDPWSTGIAHCPTCEVDAKTGLIDTHWKSSYTLTVPQDWVSGEYLVKLVDARGHEAYITFVVRDDQRTSDLLAQIPVNTYQAYNDWGGNSLYGPNSNTPYAKDRAVKVSFNRPLCRRIHRLSPGFLSRDIQAIHFLEKNGYDVTYTTSVDVDSAPGSLQKHKAFLSVGHDEYWTLGMRDAVEKARNEGLNLAFWGGNDIYWQARYEPDREGHPRRVLVVYRFANEDPLASTDPSRTTVRWDAPPVNRPQNSLLGMVYGGETTTGKVPWVVAASAPKELLTGTGLKPGDQVPHLVGPECDRAIKNGHQPPDLVIVAASDIRNLGKNVITCNSTWYQAKSGAYVFYAGTTSWTSCLDPFGQNKANMAADPRMMKFTQNMLAIFGAQPASQASP